MPAGRVNHRPRAIGAAQCNGADLAGIPNGVNAVGIAAAVEGVDSDKRTAVGSEAECGKHGPSDCLEEGLSGLEVNDPRRHPPTKARQAIAHRVDREDIAAGEDRRVEHPGRVHLARSGIERILLNFVALPCGDE